MKIFNRIVFGVFFSSFFRNLCLKTVEQFINHEDKCDFKINTAQNILQDGKFIIIMWLGLRNILNLLSLHAFWPCLTKIKNNDHIFYFITDIPCHKKCTFRIDGFNGRRYFLKRIDLIIGNKITHFHPPCSGLETYQRCLSINCSSWNASKWHILIHLNHKS